MVWPTRVGSAMTFSSLVVDVGASPAVAAVVAAEQVHYLTWTQAADLRGLAAHAERQLQAQIGKLVLTVPSGTARAGLLAAATAAGFPDAELVSQPVAAAADPQARPDLPDDALVLVCDLNEAWSAALVRLDPQGSVSLAEESASHTLTRDGVTDAALRWLAASCRALAARAGVSLADVTAVLVTGGGARIAQVPATLRQELGRPLLVPLDPEYAVIRGAARWAMQGQRRRLVSQPATWRIEPLCWSGFPEDSRLLRWTVQEGQSFGHGALVAQLRTADDRVFDLTAAREGILLEQRTAPGSPAVPGAVLGFARSAQLIQNDRPTKRLAMKVSGEWVLTQDHQYVAECADSGAYVRLRSIANGSIVEEVRPANGAAPGNGRLFVGSGGSMALVTWTDAGQFAVWEVPTGRQLAEFRTPARPLTVVVNENQWQLASEVDKQVSVGRYRRDVAVVWDLRTGGLIEEIHGDDLQRRFAGFTSRTTAPGFAAEAWSPDGRLRAGSTCRNGHAAIWLHQADTDEELFRADLSTAEPARSAFSADGQYLLGNWSARDVSCLDVWRI